MQLDTCFQLPKLASQMNGDNVDSCIQNIYTYFCTCIEMKEDMKLHITSIQLEGIAQIWWDTQCNIPTVIPSLINTSIDIMCGYDTSDVYGKYVSMFY